MSDRMTSIILPGLNGGQGLSDYGRVSVEQMIKLYKDNAAYNLKAAQKILNAKDEDFLVTTYIGKYVQRNREIIQQPKESYDVDTKIK